METQTPSHPLLDHSVRKYLSDHPQIATIYLYNMDPHSLDLTGYDVHICSDNLKETLSHLSQVGAHKRLFISNLDPQVIDLFKASYLSSYFFEACFTIPLSWNCLFVDWSSGWSTEQRDDKGLFRNATLHGSLPVTCTLTTPTPTTIKECEFSIDSPSLTEPIFVKSNKDFIYPGENQKYVIPFQSSTYQYQMTFKQKGWINLRKILKRPSYFLIRELAPKFYDPLPEQNPVQALKKIHGLGYMSLASTFISSDKLFSLQSQFSYFESGFKIVSIQGDDTDVIMSDHPAIIFASKCPIGAAHGS